MARPPLRLLLMVLALLAIGWERAAAKPLTPKVTLLVPAYFYPAGEGLKAWNRLFTAAQQTPIVAIMNPASGPGAMVDENYVDVLDRGRKSKLTLIGYVTLSYAKRPAADIQAEIDRWVQLYPQIQGIFFDEQPSGAEHVEFVESCWAHAARRIPRGLVVSNPGVLCDQAYFETKTAATICIFEHHRDFTEYRLPEWGQPLQPHRFAALVYGVMAAEETHKLLQAAMQKRVGYWLVTDRPAPTPWEGLPSYWEKLVDEAATLNRLIDAPPRTAIPKQ